ncbi:MAG: glutathione S-transferase [Acidimicrobiales bacterium]|nr:glutathione S-transferase [Hyphomonadaceae bacterium]RZV41402.1 MAG: glutathione S-transferase [Acidimicrobiales bacterium]
MTKPDFTVYHMRASRSFRVLWLLEELGLPYAVEPIEFDFGDAGGEEYRKIHPVNKVPALVDGDTTMAESLAIMQYIMNKYSDGGLRPGIHDPEYGAYLQWYHFGEATLSAIGVTLMKQRRFLPMDKRNKETEDFAEAEMIKQLDYLASQLDGRDYVLEFGFSAADISIGYALLLLRLAKAKDKFPEPIHHYWETLKQRPAFVAASN